MDTDEAAACGAVSDEGKRRDRPVIGRHGVQGRGTGNGDAGLFGRAHGIGFIGQKEAGDRGTSSHGLTEEFVVVRQGGDFRIVPAGFRIAAKNFGGAGRGGSVRFGEDDIEGDRGRTGFGQESVSRATSVRGQGHCPRRRMVSSSMSTTRTAASS